MKQFNKLIKLSIISTTLLTPLMSTYVNADKTASLLPIINNNNNETQISINANNSYESMKNNIIQLSIKYGHLSNVPLSLQNQVHTIFFNNLTKIEFRDFWNNLSSKYESRGVNFWSLLRMSYLCGVVAMSSNGGLNCGAGGQWQVCRY